MIGVGRNAASLEQAVRLGAIDRGATDLDSAVADADLVVVCTPVNRSPLMSSAPPAAAPPTCSSPTWAARNARSSRPSSEIRAPPRLSWALIRSPGPSAAGPRMRAPISSKTASASSRPRRRTPLDRTRETLALWTSLGCRVVEMSPAEHDEILAYTSHLPHAAGRGTGRLGARRVAAAGRRRLSRRHPCRRRRHRALGGHLPRKPRAHAQSPGHPAELPRCLQVCPDDRR